ncbi:MAG: aminodeoxychorismate synthase component I [Bacteroidetes bacterium GWF2_40_14]|nr:MAG: aminodeoxychorismate synthase component I [Bacteroidetes bacterium GWF2_40_14]
MSRYISAYEVRELMNSSGSNYRPFLFAVDYELERGIFVEEPMNQNDILFRFGAVRNYTDSDITIDKSALKIIDTVSYATYESKFNVVMDGLIRGDSYLLNLTARTEIETSLEIREIMLSANSPFGFCAGDHFVSFSPERFVRIENGIISSFPMKGTIDASLPDAEEIIMNDYKESCEHNTIVDLIRNDLGMVSESVWVERFRYIEKIETNRNEILQVSSEIRGRLYEGNCKRLGDTIFSLLPAGSISGAPKPSTISIISEAEGEKRGFYTGICGYYDGRVLDSAVLIRYIERDESGKLFYRSGGGITVNSKCSDEYEELIEKIYLPQTRL